MSWASVVKRNATTATTATKPRTTATTATATTATATTATATTAKPITPLEQEQEWFSREIGLTQESLTIIEKEDEAQCRPTWVRLQRPDAPSAVPVFKTRDEMQQWESAGFWKNHAYSDEVFGRRMLEWRTKNNWLLPPMKTTVSKYEQTRGFYVSDAAVVSYMTPFSTDADLSQDADPIKESMIDMMWCLIHSRSDELVACSTVTDFKALFERNVHLEPDLRRAHLYSRRKNTFPLKMLWLLSQKANVFPGKARPGSARWTTDPVRTGSFPLPFDPNVYSKSMVFFSTHKCRDANNAIVIGQHGGREETGICVVQQLKQNGDAATIRWLLSAKQLREMERVEFVAECSPFRESIDYDSDCYGYDDDW